MIKWEQTAKGKTQELRRRIYLATYKTMSEEDVETLRRAELTLNNWSEKKCGWNGQYASYALVRDVETNLPYIETHPFSNAHDYIDLEGLTLSNQIADLEAGALRRVAIVCERKGFEFFYQTDPRGCSLYIANAGDGMNDTNYSSFVPCHVG